MTTFDCYSGDDDGDVDGGDEDGDIGAQKAVGGERRTYTLRLRSIGCKSGKDITLRQRRRRHRIIRIRRCDLAINYRISRVAVMISVFSCLCGGVLRPETVRENEAMEE